MLCNFAPVQVTGILNLWVKVKTKATNLEFWLHKSPDFHNAPCFSKNHARLFEILLHLTQVWLSSLSSAFHVCSRWESVTNVSSSWVLHRFLRFFLNCFPMWHAKSIEISIQTTNKKPENICSKRIWWKCLQRATVLWFSLKHLGPNFDLFPLKVHLYVDRPRPWLHELGLQMGCFQVFFFSSWILKYLLQAL